MNLEFAANHDSGEPLTADFQSGFLAQFARDGDRVGFPGFDSSPR